MSLYENILIKLLMQFLLLTFLSVAVSTEGKDFSNTPLFIKNGVQPNILFGMDDSGSMGWETVFPKNVTSYYRSLSDVLDVDIRPDFKVSDQFYDWREIIVTCAGTNVMYFDPRNNYEPWSGQNSKGNEFDDVAATNAYKNPFYTNSGEDLTILDYNVDGYRHTAGYFKWLDLDNDGEWDPWVDLNGNNKFDAFIDRNGNGKMDLGVDEDGDGVFEVLPDTEMECPLFTQDGDIRFGLRYLEDWYVETSEMSAKELQNFANWYSYYRKREYVMKAATSKIIKNSIARVGLITLNDEFDFNEIKDVDDISTPVDDDAVSNKKALLNKLFRVDSRGGTPLRRTLEKMGNYFEGSYYNSKYGRFASPILGEDEGGQCQQNFAILMSDGTWNGFAPSVGNADSGRAGSGDKYDSDFDGYSYADEYNNAQNTLADVAMHFYERDLSGLDNNVPTISGVDENNKQHMVTYTVAFGLEGTLDLDLNPRDYDLPENDPKHFPGWPTPLSGGPTTIDDMWHAAYNGRGLYLNAQNPDELIRSLNDSIQDIQNRTSTASTVAVTTGSFNGLTKIFRAQFDSTDWEGRLQGISLEWDENKGTLTMKDNENDIINASKIPTHNDRLIATYSGSDGVPFRWDNLTASQKATVGSEKLLNFIRGDDSNEGEHSDSYRERTIAADSFSALGDLINSTPVFVVDPTFNYPDNLESDEGSAYSNYRKDPDGNGEYKTYSIAGYDGDGDGVDDKFNYYRTPMVYVGGNDGMLHGFNVDPNDSGTDKYGKETFAYVPSMVMDRFSSLSRQDFRHVYTVDGSPVVGDAYIDSAWRTLLLGGLNSGGQGIYALDISQPQKFTSESNVADTVLWEFDDSDDKDLGFTYSKPIIAKSNLGTTDKWVAIFGNGYNNTYSDSNVGSGTAVLYVVDLLTGSLIKKIDTGKNDLSTPNGLSSPKAVDIDGDYRVDYVYAGDLEGNLWKFDISANDSGSWAVDFSGKPLFTACAEATCDLTNRQPITTEPVISANRWSDSGGYLVYFGTGSYMYDDDLYEKGLQTFYAIWDKDDASLVEFNRNHLLAQHILQEQNFKTQKLQDGSLVTDDAWNRRTTDQSQDSSAYAIHWHEENSLPSDGADDNSLVDTHLGWYMDLIVKNPLSNEDAWDYEGERIVLPAKLDSDYVEFYTLTPNEDPCSAGSITWIMRLDPKDGSQTKKAQINIGEDLTTGDALGDDYGHFTGNNADEDAAGYWEVSSGGLLGSMGECVHIVLPNGSEVCLTEKTVISGSSDAGLGRWSWKELN